MQDSRLGINSQPGVSGNTNLYIFFLFFKCILLIMLLQFSHFFLPFLPICPVLPFLPAFPPPQFMSMGRTYKFFGFSISCTILDLPLSILFLAILLLIPCTFPPIRPLPTDNPPCDLYFFLIFFIDVPIELSPFSHHHFSPPYPPFNPTPLWLCPWVLYTCSLTTLPLLCHVTPPLWSLSVCS